MVVHVDPTVKTPRNLKIVLAVLACAVLAAIPFYRPLKFRYAIWRIESAKTPEQERTACILARRVGHIWELNRMTPKPPGQFTDNRPARAWPASNEVVMEIEWWEGPRPMGLPPYRAYRVFLDQKNLDVLSPGFLPHSASDSGWN